MGIDYDERKKAEKVLQIVEKFVFDQRIFCEETIYQCDRVIENAYDLIADVINVAGFLLDAEDEE